MPEQRFPYGARRSRLLLAIAFFGACGGLFVHLALTNASVRLWPLPIMVNGAPVFGLAALSFAFVVVGAAQIVRAWRLGPRVLIIGDNFLEAPRNPWTAATIRVQRASIRNVRETEVAGTRIVEIVLDERKVSLSNRTVGDDGYAAVMAWLAERR